MWVTLACVPDSPARPVGGLDRHLLYSDQGFMLSFCASALPKADPGPVSEKLHHEKLGKSFTFVPEAYITKTTQATDDVI